MKKTKLSWILCGICAALCSVRVVLDIVQQTYQTSMFWFYMDCLGALLWVIALFVCLNRLK